MFHCIYWEPGFPKYIKNKHLSTLTSQKNLRLIGVCDVTCDLDGSIECLKEYTQPEVPFFYYDSAEEKDSSDPTYKEGKILYLAIDFLPCELAFDAAMHFSRLLKDWVPQIVKSDKNQSIEDQILPS